MSSPSIRSDSNSLDESNTTRDRCADVLGAVKRSVFLQLRAVGFWTAVALPFLYVPLLTFGLDERTHAIAFLGLLALNLVALLVGRGHTPKSPPEN
jgi:hypothetical protein